MLMAFSSCAVLPLQVGNIEHSSVENLLGLQNVKVCGHAVIDAKMGELYRIFLHLEVVDLIGVKSIQYKARSRHWPRRSRALKSTISARILGRKELRA